MGSGLANGKFGRFVPPTSKEELKSFEVIEFTTLCPVFVCCFKAMAIEMSWHRVTMVKAKPQ